MLVMFQPLCLSNATAFNQDIGGWDVSKVNIPSIFRGATTRILAGMQSYVYARYV